MVTCKLSKYFFKSYIASLTCIFELLHNIGSTYKEFGYPTNMHMQQGKKRPTKKGGENSDTILQG